MTLTVEKGYLLRQWNFVPTMNQLPFLLFNVTVNNEN